VRYDKTVVFLSVVLIEVTMPSLRKKFSAFHTRERFLAEELRPSSVQLKQLVSSICKLRRARNAELHKQDKYRGPLHRRYSEYLGEKKSCQ